MAEEKKEKYVPLNKKQKKLQKLANKAQRVMVSINTGTRTHENNSNTKHKMDYTDPKNWDDPR